MTDINHVILIGRLTHDIGTDSRSFAYTPNGTARANVSIAVNRSEKQNGEWVDVASFFDVTIWGKTAENLKPYLTKGKQIAVDGYLKQERWKDSQGNNRYAVKVMADTVQLLGGKDAGNGGYQGGGNSTGGFTQRQNSAQANNADVGTSEDFPEDIPF